MEEGICAGQDGNRSVTEQGGRREEKKRKKEKVIQKDSATSTSTIGHDEDPNEMKREREKQR